MRYILSLISLAMALIASAQALPLDSLGSNSAMRSFYQGCLKIRAGESTGDLTAYEDAMELLNERVIDISRLNVTPIDTTALAHQEERVEFSYGYAKAKANMTPYRPDGQLRPVPSSCRVKNIAIMPHSKVVYQDRVRKRCVFLAVAAEPDAMISVSVTDCATETTYGGSEYENGAVGMVKWVQERMGNVRYTIENKSDCVVSVVMVAN